MGLQKNLNALLIVILMGVILSAFGVQFILHEEPCPLCLLQRIGMILVAISSFLNLKFGIKMSHYALGILASIFGGFVALRQISLHVCPQFPTFGDPVFGVSLYTWSFFVFVSSVLFIAFLLCLYDPKGSENEPAPLNIWGWFAVIFLAFITVANVAATWMQCGLGPCHD